MPSFFPSSFLFLLLSNFIPFSRSLFIFFPQVPPGDMTPPYLPILIFILFNTSPTSIFWSFLFFLLLFFSFSGKEEKMHYPPNRYNEQYSVRVVLARECPLSTSVLVLYISIGISSFYDWTRQYLLEDYTPPAYSSSHDLTHSYSWDSQLSGKDTAVKHPIVRWCPEIYENLIVGIVWLIG